jgi:hypothetical protein
MLQACNRGLNTAAVACLLAKTLLAALSISAVASSTVIRQSRTGRTRVTDQCDRQDTEKSSPR